jgi:hypothetical protein
MPASTSPGAALNSGYHVAFLFGAIFAAIAGILGRLLLRPGLAGGAQLQAAGDASSPAVDASRDSRAATENY